MEWKSFVLTEDNGKILLIREAKKKWLGKWYLPGGGVEPGETPETGALREVQEEAGCRVRLTGLFYLDYREDIFRRTFTLFYSATLDGPQTPKRIADKHSLEANWFSYEEIRRLEGRRGLLEVLNAYRTGRSLPLDHLKITG